MLDVLRFLFDPGGFLAPMVPLWVGVIFAAVLLWWERSDGPPLGLRSRPRRRPPPTPPPLVENIKPKMSQFELELAAFRKQLQQDLQRPSLLERLTRDEDAHDQ